MKEVVATLMRSLVGPDVSPPDFLRRAEALKRALAAPMTGAAPETATTASLALQEDDGFRGVHPKVEAAIRVLHTAVALHRPVSEEDVAREVRLHAAHLGRLLKCYTGHGFREWRRALQMREAVMLLVHTHEHVDQIAYCRLAYDHAAQFSRDFRRTFGVSPRCFRQLYAAAERLARVAARKATV